MAINENPSLPNRHTGYLAKSGYGKSQALKQNKAIPRSGARVILWDPNKDHETNNRFFDRAKFARFLVNAMRSRKGFRIAWSGVQDVATFEWFSALVWKCLNGNKLLYILIEELAAVQPSSGTAPPNFSILCNQSRKYGGILHWTTQRSPEISQTVLEATEHSYVCRPGRMVTPQQADRLARLAGCPNGKADLQVLKPLEFYYSDGEKTEFIKLKYKGKSTVKK